MAPAGTAEAANPGPGARAAEEDRQQDVVMTTQPTKPEGKPEGKPKPQHAVELSSSDSYESEQDKAEAPKTPDSEAAAKAPAPRTPESPEAAAAKAPKTPESPEAAPKAAETGRAPKARRNRRSIQEEGMVQCPICWTPVKKDGLESHQQYSSYCAQWRKFQERGQKAEKGPKGQQGKDDEDGKKKCPHCDRQFNKRWDLLQHCLRFHPKSKEARECSEHMRGRKAKPAESSQGARAGSGSANRTRSTDRVRLRSRTRRASRARRHDDSRDGSDGSCPRTRSRPRHHETREAREQQSSPSPTPGGPGSSRSSKPGPGAATVLESFLQTTTRILDLQDRKG